MVYTIPFRGSYRKVANSADAKNVRKTIEHNFRNAQVVKERDEHSLNYSGAPNSSPSPSISF